MRTGQYISISPQKEAAERDIAQAIGLVLLFAAVALVGSLWETNAFASAYGYYFPGYGWSNCRAKAGGNYLENSGGTQYIFDPVCNILVDFKFLIIGTTGKAIATLAVLTLGAMALFGKLTWKQALIVVIGVALLFGAAGIVINLGGGNTFSYAYTASADPVANLFFALTNEITGTTGKAVGVIALVIIGVGALMGKVSWTQALILVIGIGLVFGSVQIIHNVQYSSASGETCGYGVDDPVCDSFYAIVSEMSGQMGASLATLGVTALGFMAMMGKISWVRAMLVAVGIAFMFAAGDVVAILTAPLSPCSVTNSDPFTQVICGFMNELQGPTGKMIATLAVVIVGVLSMLGKVSWELGFVVAVGITLIFGANALVELFEASMAGVECNSDAPSAPSTGNAIADVLCYIILILYGPAGKSLATVAVIMMGFGALMGKVSFSQAFIVAAGIAVTFGAPAIEAIILPSASTTGCTVTPATGGSCP